MSVTKKSNVLDKPKPNILNSAAKKLHNSETNNNNNNNNAGADINDTPSHRTSYRERDPSPPAPVAPAAPEVTVSLSLSR